jgi:curli biogenesis system outer membrane secretion channel CsgG
MLRANRSHYLPCLLAALAMALAVIPSAAASITAGLPAAPVPEQAANPSSKIHVTARCISSLQTYRQAIRFLELRLERSPPSVTITVASGESFTLLNRTHMTLHSDKRTLERGMADRARACHLALAD